LRFSAAGDFKFTTDNKLLNYEKNNLVIKAKELLEKESGKNINVEIELEKRIPIGAGLGGGSSNAAAVLISLNNLLELKIPNRRIAEIALELGSDVPFFLNPVPCFAESRGEITKPLDLKIKDTILIVNPGIHISTAWAFSKIKPAKSDNALMQVIKQNKEIDYGEWKEKIVNDFEMPVFTKYPEIEKIKEYLYNFGAQFALMTGSGSTTFAIYKEANKAAEAKRFFEEKNYFTYLEI
jgi:4-diphosphocytidyl-2-C-methyl-D-erythritol kinase